MTEYKVEPKGPKLRQDQRGYLEERLKSAARAHENRIYREDRKEPPEVRRSRKIIEKYENDTDAKKETVLKRITADRIKVKEAILFSEPEKALALVREFEKRQYKLPVQNKQSDSGASVPSSAVLDDQGTYP